MERNNSVVLDRMVERGTEYRARNDQPNPPPPEDDELVQLSLTDGSKKEVALYDYDELGVTLLEYDYEKELWRNIFIPWINIKEVSCY